MIYTKLEVSLTRKMVRFQICCELDCFEDYWLMLAECKLAMDTRRYKNFSKK